MAISNSVQAKRTANTPDPLFIGIAALKIVGFNPSIEQYNKIYKNPAKKITEDVPYVGVNETSGNNFVKFVFHLQHKGAVSPFQYTFTIVNKIDVSKNNETRYINSQNEAVYATSAEEAVQKMKDKLDNANSAKYYNKFTIPVKMDFRPALVGEHTFYTFLKNILGESGESDMNFSMEELDLLFTGDFTPITLSGFIGMEFCSLLMVSGNGYQTLNPDVSCPYSQVQAVMRLSKKIKKDIERSIKDKKGLFGYDCFDKHSYVKLQAFNPEANYWVEYLKSTTPKEDVGASAEDNTDVTAPAQMEDYFAGGATQPEF